MKRDEPGPEHQPSLFESKIEGVVLAMAPDVSFAHGHLTELYRKEWVGVFKEGEPIDHLYTVHSPVAEKRTEWYFHEFTTDRYMVLLGQLRVGLFDSRAGSPSAQTFEEWDLGGAGTGKPNMVRIPPHVWHSLEWGEGGGIFLNAKIPPYNRLHPDKFRIPEDQVPPEICW